MSRSRTGRRAKSRRATAERRGRRVLQGIGQASHDPMTPRASDVGKAEGLRKMPQVSIYIEIQRSLSGFLGALVSSCSLHSRSSSSYDPTTIQLLMALLPLVNSWNLPDGTLGVSKLPLLRRFVFAWARPLISSAATEMNACEARR